MKLVRLARARHLGMAMLAGVALTACQGSGPSYSPTSEQRALLAVVQAAYVADTNERQPKDTADAAFPHDHTVPDGKDPRLTIATMTLQPGHPPTQPKLIARITSKGGDYPPMGIQEGINYVWQDTVTKVAWIQPPAAANDTLESTPNYQFPRKPEHQPSIYRVKAKSVGFVLCLDDCGSGHCGMY